MIKDKCEKWRYAVVGDAVGGVLHVAAAPGKNVQAVPVKRNILSNN
jgi:hypothetical protein